VVSKVLLELLGGIFNERFFYIKNVDKIKNVKKRQNVTGIKNVKNIFYIYGTKRLENILAKWPTQSLKTAYVWPVKYKI